MKFKEKTEVRNSEFLECSFPVGDSTHFYLYQGSLAVDCPRHGPACRLDECLDDSEYVVEPGLPGEFVLEVYDCADTSIFTEITEREAQAFRVFRASSGQEQDASAGKASEDK